MLTTLAEIGGGFPKVCQAYSFFSCVGSKLPAHIDVKNVSCPEILMDFHLWLTTSNLLELMSMPQV